ncbi:MAG: ShlB/FhaC/HecB family hemolysin secretion/activation protein [Alphaproteobacteria bacterium]|nr:ShlB/FhaC/HecB family hemolysin secretion/activation protein [Alphaproteobacteria bacterium]
MAYPVANRKNVTPRCIRLLAGVPLLSALILASAGLSPALAVEVPAAVNPGQVEKQFQAPEKTNNHLELNLPAPTESQPLSDILRAQLEKNKFVLKGIVIDGATVYKAEDLASAYQDKIGQEISLLDAREIAARITAHYRNDGYILSQAIVPVQTITNGELHIRVVEGYLDNVTFEGDVGSDREKRALESFADKIKATHPTKMADLERYMLLMNDLPGETVTGLIRPAESQFGAADLVLTVNQKVVEGSYTFDNRGSKYIGPWEHTFMLGANSLLDSFDHTQLRVETADPLKELFGIQLQHDEILDSEGTKLSLSASHFRTEPNSSYLEGLHVVGDSDLFEAKVSHPFMRLREQTIVGTAIFDVHNTSNDLPDIPYTLSTDRLRVARVGGLYSFLDDMLGSDLVNVQLSQGMNIFNATSSGDVRSNPIGNSAFTKTNFDVSRLQQLPGNFSFLTGATAQYSFDPLLTDEQFSLGGADYGRAFDPAEALGDSGIAGKFELRYDGRVDEPYFDSYQLFTFYDVGEAWVRGAAATGVASDSSLSSMGLGARTNFTSYLSSSLEFDVPVIRPPDDPTSYRHDPRIFFSLSAHF